MSDEPFNAKDLGPIALGFIAVLIGFVIGATVAAVFQKRQSHRTGQQLEQPVSPVDQQSA